MTYKISRNFCLPTTFSSISAYRHTYCLHLCHLLYTYCPYAYCLLPTFYITLNCPFLTNNLLQDVEKQRIYVCNVCKQSYPQAANLDVHMRSMTHQSRMSRLSELVATGELNGEKAVFEQPGIPAPTINSFIETVGEGFEQA